MKLVTYYYCLLHVHDWYYPALLSNGNILNHSVRCCFNHWITLSPLYLSLPLPVSIGQHSRHPRHRIACLCSLENSSPTGSPAAQWPGSAEGSLRSAHLVRVLLDGGVLAAHDPPRHPPREQRVHQAVLGAVLLRRFDRSGALRDRQSSTRELDKTVSL